MCRGLSNALERLTLAVPPDGGGAPTTAERPMLDLCEGRRANIGEGEVEGLDVECWLVGDNKASGDCCGAPAPAGWAAGCHIVASTRHWQLKH